VPGGAAGADVGAVTRLETIAELVGTRIGMLRVMQQTHLQAATDALTGLLNRRTVEDRAHELLRHGIPFALAMGDLDHFKEINDTHGHDAGDRALRLFARTLQTTFRSEDVVARFGGEEFVILFPNRTTTEAAAALERVREQLVLAIAAGPVPGFTASFGVSHSDEWTDLEELLRAADNALFRAKREGRNRVIVEGLLTT
jgi:diguanylate cyclase (GGDEF)-like protein